MVIPSISSRKVKSQHETKKPLVKDEEAVDVDVHIYRSMIGFLMYLTSSRPDIMYAVCACFRFQITPKTLHLQAVKRIFRYLKGQPKMGIWYPRDSPFDLDAYSDSDYAGANLDRKSTTRGKITPLFPSMLTQAAVEEGEDSGTPAESQPTPSPTQPSVGDQPPLTESSSEHDTSQDLRGHRWEWKGSGQMEFVSKRGRKSAKPRLKLDDSAGLNVDGVEYMETEEAVDEGRTSNKIEELNLDADTKVIAGDKGSGEKGESIISTARPKRVSTADVTISTADLEVSAIEPKTPPTTTSIFNDEDITMAQTLIKMKEEKAKEKRVVFKEVEEFDRPTRSVLTLKPLPTIDLKDKGKAVLEEPEPKKMTRNERAKLLAEYFERRKKQLAKERATAIRNKPSTRTQLRRLMMTYLKYTCSFTHSQINKRTFEEIQALYIKKQEKVANFVPVRSDEDERLIQKMNEKAADVHKEKVLEEPYSTKVLKMKARKKARKQTHADDESSDKGVDSSKKRKAEDGTEIHMLAERRLMNLKAMIEEKRIFECWFYHHTTNGHQFTMSNRHQELASPEANDFCKELANPKQTALGKDISSPLIVDSSLKTIWLSVHHVIAMKHWLFQSKRLL
nr:uncharacterized mitochondrial protein AtMg00810-like [Tanacetum cinerariifolium]